jgi:hypothetical protein
MRFSSLTVVNKELALHHIRAYDSDVIRALPFVKRLQAKRSPTTLIHYITPEGLLFPEGHSSLFLFTE